MNEALELLLQIIENSKDGGELPILNTLASNKSFLVWDPDVSKFKLISKSAITFTGEPPSKTTDLTDFPDSLLGQKGKIAKIKEDESGWEFVVLADVTGVTQTELNTAIEGANAYAESLLGGQASPTRIDSWVLGYDSGLTFNPTFNFTVDGVSYSDSRQITLAAADPTNPRKDTFVVNIQTEQIEVLTGIPSPNPAEPDVDFSIYLKGATVDIPAGATTPANINIKTLYDENLGTAGGETDTSGGVDFDFDNTENPSSGTKAIKVVGELSVSQAIVLSLGTDLPIADAKEIQLDIQNITAGGNFHVTLLGKKSNGRTESYILPTPTGFDPANITSYQTITQSISTNQLVSIYAVQIVNDVAGFKFYLDKVRFLGGEGTSAPTGDYVTRTEFNTLDSEVVKSVSVNGGTPVTPDPSGNVDLTVSEAGGSSTTEETGTTINFTQDHIYNKSAPISGNITIDPTGAVLGTTVVVYVNASAEPTISGANNIFQSGRFQAAKLCAWWFYWRGDGYSLNKTVDNRPQIATPENFTGSVVSETEVSLSWDAVTGANNYILYRSTSNDFTTASEIYSGGTNSYSDTGLTADTLYYYWLLAQGSLNADSDLATTSVTTSIPLLSDTFTGTTIDTGKWTVYGSGTDISVTQNDELIFTDLNTKTTGVTEAGLDSVLTVNTASGLRVLKFDVSKNPVNDTFYGIQFKIANTNDLIRLQSDPDPSLVRFAIKKSGTLTSNVSFTKSINNSFKIVVNGTTAQLYIWENSAWSLLATESCNTNTYYINIFRANDTISGTVANLDNLHLTDYDYSTLNP
ncbi:fibronectin type III domain-containing protein [Christiangramia crocea]|uniref:Fibronectin type III domain-containing protein n=1 Tax=Christiangramia crocea TaxID=2904124 RepID=A0A9X1UV58_9FLAO|nr:fibronectin type III domain-containing protein [Gramella crocea]MCG9970987.1 fibronectin type III domain-containing protein [Gramella crocea]